jgi:hypothetical protein
VNTSGKMRYILTHLPVVFLFSGKMRYLINYFDTSALIHCQKDVSSDSFCHWCSYSVAKRGIL